ncbi:hypothetical protein OEZ78_28240, partial [Leclercia adecarboxylata]|uniref:hypothetical protein n=1 Tax=Leclercia adecarboxylata TaxID=83655 RepID=UPI00234CABB3
MSGRSGAPACYGLPGSLHGLPPHYDYRDRSKEQRHRDDPQDSGGDLSDKEHVEGAHGEAEGGEDDDADEEEESEEEDEEDEEEE